MKLGHAAAKESAVKKRIHAVIYVQYDGNEPKTWSEVQQLASDEQYVLHDPTAPDVLAALILLYGAVAGDYACSDSPGAGRGSIVCNALRGAEKVIHSFWLLALNVA